jgi:peptidoglycan/xylan/chitin deacetylase (PgdA/CDA1 family)
MTCDDAPCVPARDGEAPSDPGRLDTVRKVLEEHGLRHCVAFVIGSEARAGAGAIARWLDAGYEVGNHTFRHRRASETTPEEYLADVDLCDRELAAIGALRPGATRYFRFPYLDRGRTAEDRARIRAGLRERGHVTVHATVDFYDHRYEGAMERARREGDERRAARIEDRYARVAAESLRYRAALMARVRGRPVVHVPYFHVGPTSSRSLPKLLRHLAAMGAVALPVAEALADPTHRAFEEDASSNGLISDGDLPQSLLARGARKAAHATHRLGLLGQAAAGPRWPYLG